MQAFAAGSDRSRRGWEISRPDLFFGKRMRCFPQDKKSTPISLHCSEEDSLTSEFYPAARRPA
jgi:hypothetical protein